MKSKVIITVLALTAGVFIGWLLFHSPHNKTGTGQITEQSAENTIWTCSMHPQIRSDHPGKCPICGMDLIPLKTGNTVMVDPDAISLSKEAAEIAKVQTSVVTEQNPVKEVRLYGKVEADERLLQSQTAQMPGRIEKLLVNYTGEMIHAGKPIAEIYSPELTVARQELLEAAKMKDSQPGIYEAAKNKLRQWKLTETQIESMENSGKVNENFEIVSNTSGIIISRRVNNGDHVSQGTVLFDVAGLSDVWIMFDAFESDLPFLKTGDRVRFTVGALPGTDFTGRIDFIDPVIDPLTRVAKVRVQMNNEKALLKPEMFVTGIVSADLKQYAGRMIIPASAVLWTGTRSLVYVKQPDTDQPVFKMREVELGPSLGYAYVVNSGLVKGEEIVTNGAYSVDASAQLAGKPSMMNPRQPGSSSNK